MVKKKIIFFDLDGTLVDVSNRLYLLHHDLSKIYMFKPLSFKTYLRLKRDGIDEKEIISKVNISPAKCSGYLKKRLKLIETKKYLKRDKLKYGIRRLLKRLRGSHTLVLITKRHNERNCEEEIRRLGIKEYFSQIIIAGSIAKDQPIKKILNQSFYKKIALIGDSEEDYIAAQKLGIKCILVSDGIRSKEYLSRLKPDYLFNSLNKIDLAML